jgi:CBS domain-containing protein
MPGLGGSMSKIYDLVKDHESHTITADATVLDAAQQMVANNIGAVPVLRDGNWSASSPSATS